MRKSYFYIIFFLIISLGTFLRFFKLSELPAVLHRDEASIGFNAYSILKTGKDEHGVSWPISFRAFADYKLPGLIYLTAPSLAIFQFNPFAIRFPNALFGSLLIPLSYLFAYSLFKRKGSSLLLAFFVASSPIFITASRNAYEPALAIFFDILALLFFYKAREKSSFFYLSFFFTFISSYFYHSAILLVPLLFAFILYLYRDEFKKSIAGKKRGIFFLFLYIFTLTFNIWSIHSVNQSRSGTTLLSNQTIQEEIFQNNYLFSSTGIPRIFARVINNKITLPSTHFVKNYLITFDPNFLFFKGDHNPWHNLEALGFGNLLFPILFFFFFSLVSIFKRPYRTWNNVEKFLLFYLLVSPLLNAITIDAPISNRLFHFHFAFLLFSAYSMEFIVESKKGKTLFSIFIATYLLIFCYFIFHYFFLFNKKLDPQWHEGLPAMAKELKKYEADYDAIYIKDPPMAYSYLAVYQHWDPQEFQEDAERINEYFDDVWRYKKYRFEPFPAERVLLTTDNLAHYLNQKEQKILLLGKAHSEEMRLHQIKKIFQIENFEGKALWFAYEFNLAEFVSEARVQNPNSLNLPYLESLILPDRSAKQ